MSFLLLLGLLMPAITHTQEQPSDIKHLFGLKHKTTINALNIAEPFEEETFIKAQQTYKDLESENTGLVCDNIKKALHTPKEEIEGLSEFFVDTDGTFLELSMPHYTDFKHLFYARAIYTEYKYLHNKALRNKLDISHLPTPKQLKYVTSIESGGLVSDCAYSCIFSMNKQTLPKKLFPAEAQRTIEQKVNTLDSNAIATNLNHINNHALQELNYIRLQLMNTSSRELIEREVGKDIQKSIVDIWKQRYRNGGILSSLEGFFAKGTVSTKIDDFTTSISSTVEHCGGE